MPYMSPPPLEAPPVGRWTALARVGWLAELATALYIALIAVVAQGTGFVYVLFPELGALSHDILKRPHGTWARAPLLLVVTPFLTAVIGTLRGIWSSAWLPFSSMSAARPSSSGC